MKKNGKVLFEIAFLVISMIVSGFCMSGNQLNKGSNTGGLKVKAPSGLTICPWRNDAQGAISIRCDDYPHTHNMYNTGIDLATQRGIGITFALVKDTLQTYADYPDYQTVMDSTQWNKTKQFVAAGHEFVNHTSHHFPTTSGSGYNYASDIDDNATAIEKNLGVPVRAWIRPGSWPSFPDYWSAVGGAANYLTGKGNYIGYSDDPNNETLFKFLNGLGSTSIQMTTYCGDSANSFQDINTIKSYIDSCISQGKWGGLLMHDIIDYVYHPCFQAVYTQFLDYCKQKRDAGSLFCAPVTEVARYIVNKQKCIPTIVNEASGSFEISFNMQGLSASLFGYPLTIKVDAGFSVSNVSQNGSLIGFTKLSGNNIKFDANPFNGYVNVTGSGGSTPTPTPAPTPTSLPFNGKKVATDISKITKYIPTWESIDSHPSPDWFDDAKLGMFIDFGPWSIPGWAPRREKGAMYPDMYPGDMYNDPVVKKYHKEHWGENFQWDDFVKMFKGEDFNAETIVEIAKSAGMKYVIPFAKSHDGYCMWDCAYTHCDAMEMAPKRDFIQEFVDQCRKNNLKFGFYNCIEEWWYPLIGENNRKMMRCWNDTAVILPYDSKIIEGKIAGKIPVNDYTDDYIVPQAKEFFDKYDPDIYWADGDWTMDESHYKSKEVVAYFYNHAEGRKEVVANDRFGRTRGKHGDFYASEFHNGNMSLSHKWEECRSLGQSFGYNREDTEKNLLTTEQLVQMFADIVSKGGNLLLMVNLDEKGVLDKMQVNRLEELGEWLKTNGEAIYGTRKWGKYSHSDVAGITNGWDNGFLLQNPERIRYTCKKDTVYAITYSWPKDDLVLDINIKQPPAKTRVSLIGLDKQLPWKYENGKMHIDITSLKSTQLPCKWAWALRITGGIELK